MIFGTNAPKFVTGSTTVNLDYVTVDTNLADVQEIEHTSVITGVRNYVVLGDYAEIKINMNLYKYDSPSIKFQEIYQYTHDNVYFYLHNDGNAFQDSGSNNVEFHITKIEPYYIDNVNYNEGLKIELKSRKYIDLIQLVV